MNTSIWTRYHLKELGLYTYWKYLWTSLCQGWAYTDTDNHPTPKTSDKRIQEKIQYVGQNSYGRGYSRDMCESRKYHVISTISIPASPFLIRSKPSSSTSVPNLIWIEFKGLKPFGRTSFHFDFRACQRSHISLILLLILSVSCRIEDSTHILLGRGFHPNRSR